MIGLLQRVAQAHVEIAGETIAAIPAGLLVLVGIVKQDNEHNADRLLKRLLEYRVFADAQGKMNLSLRDTKGDLLLVPQFTLAADTHSGRRPSFSTAAPPAQGNLLFDYLVAQAKAQYVESQVACGRFGADMQVFLQNDGPVTFWLDA